MDLNARVADIAADRRSGAAEMAARVAEILELAVTRTPARDAASLRRALAPHVREMVRAQPAMAPLVALAAVVLGVIDERLDLESARAMAIAATAAFRERIDRAGREIAMRTEGLVPGGGRVLTLSASATVRSALLEAGRHRSFDVLCLEGRPHYEGRSLAADLAGAGLRVTLAVDAAAAAVIRNCDVVLVGADSIGDLGVVNKVGTRVAALAARSAGVPIYALADTTKILPVGFPQYLDEDRPADEVWADAPEGVAIWNRYFEPTPLSIFAGIATEQGLRNGDELERLRAGLRLPSDLWQMTAP